MKAKEEGRLRTGQAKERSGAGFSKGQALAKQAWDRIIDTLARSDSAEDRALAEQADLFVRSTPFAVRDVRKRDQVEEQQRNRAVADTSRVVTGPREDRGIVR